MNISYNKASKNISKWAGEITNNSFNKTLFILLLITLGLYGVFLGTMLLIYLPELPSIIMGTFDSTGLQLWGLALFPLILTIWVMTPIGIISLLILTIRTKSKILFSFILILILIFIFVAKAYDFKF